jgi:hypothetical protein
MATTYVKGRIYKLDVNSLQADPQQPRKYLNPEALNELTASIQKHGVLQMNGCIMPSRPGFGKQFDF